MNKLLVLAGATSMMLSGSLFAGQISVDAIDGGLSLNAADLNSILFTDASPTFAVTDMYNVQEHILNHSSGISLDGQVTIFAAETTMGLSIISLIDEQEDPSRGVAVTDTALGFSSTAYSTAARMVRDVDGTITQTEIAGLQTAAGFFEWDSTNQGSAFAWTELVAGDYGTFNFHSGNEESEPPYPYPTFPGLEADGTFQFLTWNEDSNEWELVNTSSFSANDQFAFAFNVLPVPSALGIGAAGLLGLVSIRRRRKHA
ncbi:MAG: hypothetical protein P8J86_07780 [Phycisphaerales bacterium]|jgi:hypothetical protein|nr:hypothetical protein [Phycisphaerales bacterium]